MAAFFYGLSAFFFLAGAAIYAGGLMKMDKISDRDLNMMATTAMAFMMLASIIFLATLFGQWMGS